MDPSRNPRDTERDQVTQQRAPDVSPRDLPPKDRVEREAAEEVAHAPVRCVYNNTEWMGVRMGVHIVLLFLTTIGPGTDMVHMPP